MNSAPENVDVSAVNALSARERQILSLAAVGYLDKQIGPELGLSLNTLRTYWSRIRSKMGEAPRTALTAAYVASELEPDEPEALGPCAHEGWIIDPSTMMLMASDGINDLHGLGRGIPHPTAAYTNLYHPEDEEVTRKTLHQVISGELDSAHLIFRLIPDSGVELVSLLVRNERDSDGCVSKVYGYRSRTLDCGPSHDPEVRIATWTRDFQTGEFQVDAEFERLFGPFPPGTDVREAALSRIDPKSRDAARSFVEDAVLAGLDNAQLDGHISLPDGQVIWVRSKVRIERHQTGDIKAFGTVVAFH